MRYTRTQYNDICRDVAAQVKTMRRLHVFGREPFMCDHTNCSYCPFLEDGVCPDADAPSAPSTWKTARTVDEWQKWLEWFATTNDPDRPVSVEISQKQRDALLFIYQNIDSLTIAKEERSTLRAVIEAFDEQTRN